MTARRGWGLPEQHLALDALVAFVDGELTANARDRAAAHLAACSACAAEANAQRQARAAVRSAGAPSVSAGLMQALQSIPNDAELPAQPDGLALTGDGQLVAVTPGRKGERFGSGPALGSSTPLGGGQPMGSSAPLGHGAALTEQAALREQAAVHEQAGLPDQADSGRAGRGRRTGAGVVFSGLVLGALALVIVPDEQGPPPVIGPLPHPGGGGAYDSALIPASAGTSSAPPAPPPQQAAATSPVSAPHEEPALSAARP